MLGYSKLPGGLYGEKYILASFNYRLVFNLIMFVHLAKRIAMPSDTLVTKCAWNVVDGYVAAGCDDGLVKVLKLEVPEGRNSFLSVLFRMFD